MEIARKDLDRLTNGDLIAAGTLAAMLHVHPNTVYRWVRNYGVRTVHVGRYEMVRGDDVAEILGLNEPARPLSAVAALERELRIIA